MEPVKKTEAPGYYQVIRFPMGMYAQNHSYLINLLSGQIYLEKLLSEH